MMRQTIMAGLLTLAASAGPAQPATLDGDASYDLLFRDGTLDSVDLANALVYARTVTNVLVPDAEARDSGRIALSVHDDDETLVQLTFLQDDRHRGIGVFPVSVGNPMIMYFYETVVRDMAEAAGGSPFYIRNRVKEALVNPAEIEAGQAVVGGTEVETTTIHLRPFADDPNRDRMMGFGDLILSVTMSDQVPGWYVSLIAEAEGEDGPVYRSSLIFDGIEAPQ